MKNKVSKKQFLADVKHEIDSLKANGTKEELSKLNLDIFDPDNANNCIYGQMTGDCESSRAKVLMDKSCVRQTKAVNSGVRDFRNKTYSEASENINGQYEGNTWIGSARTYTYLSVLEAYICLKNANISGIISYMKGEADDVKL